MPWREVIAQIPQHAEDLPAESTSPFRHYRRGANDAWNLLVYFERNIKRTNVYPKSYDAHLANLRATTFSSVAQSFERFLKELAAVCVDELVCVVSDDRFSDFDVKPRVVVAHFDEGTLGRALAEGSTWFDTKEHVAKRFKKLLSWDAEPDFQFFPQDNDAIDGWRRGTLEIIWQLRHSIVHNVGVVTKSDALKLRLLTGKSVAAPKRLRLGHGDVAYAKSFLDDMARWSNQRVATRLSMVLTRVHERDPLLFDAATKAASLAATFGVSVTIDGAVGHP